MKKLLLVTFLALVFFLYPTNSLLANTPPLLETLTGPIIKSGDTVTLTGQIDGDVYLVGGKVFVDAEINGDLIILAGQVEVNGSIRDDIRIIAGQTDISANIGDDLSLISLQTNIFPSTVINNTALILSTQTKFSGQVDHQALIYSNSLELSKEAIFKDDLKITYYQDPIISSSATISGNLTTKHSDKLNYQTYLDQLSNNQPETVTKITFLVILQKFTTLTLEIFVGWILISLLPKIIKHLSKIGRSRSGSAIGWGLVTLALTPILGFLLILTLIGIPLGVSVFVIFASSIYLAKLIGALNLGQQITKNPSKPHQGFLIGIIALFILKLIPVLGWLAYLIIFLHGLGSLSLLIYALVKNKKS